MSDDLVARLTDRHKDCLPERCIGQEAAQEIRRLGLIVAGNRKRESEFRIETLERKLAEKNGCDWEDCEEGAVHCFCARHELKYEEQARRLAAVLGVCDASISHKGGTKIVSVDRVRAAAEGEG